MKKEEFFELLGELDEKSIAEAKQPAGGRRANAKSSGSAASRIRRRLAAISVLAAAAAAVLFLTLALPRILSSSSGSASPAGSASGTAHTVPGLAKIMTVSAVYPDPVAPDMDAQSYLESDAHWEWWSAYRETAETSAALQKDLNGYNASLMQKLLVSDDENTVCSPLNTYLAFSMLAEVTDGNTRAQILDALHASDIREVRSRAEALLASNCVDTPNLKSDLANSLWLRESVPFDQNTLGTLAEDYLASSFYGDTGSEEMSEALRQWTDGHTGGLLSDYTKDLRLTPDTVLAIVSTLYYKAAWVNEFLPQNTTAETFHGTAGDTEVEMMHRSDMQAVYRSDTFTALGLPLSDSGSMYFYLPEEGADVNDLLSDPEVFDAMAFDPEAWDENDPHWSFPLVNLSVPKFSVSGKTDLRETMKALGMTDVLIPGTAGFTPLLTDGRETEAEGLYVSSAEHAALVEIDENGVTGAAYTDLAVAEGAADPDDVIDFVLDRPFLFTVAAKDGSLLFAGVVRNIG